MTAGRNVNRDLICSLALNAGVSAGLCAWGVLAVCGTPMTLLAGSSQPQVGLPNPVYLDDPPAASDGLVRARELSAGGNADEAVRVLQSLLDEYAERITASAGLVGAGAGAGGANGAIVGGAARDPDVFVTVRERVHASLLGERALLKRYWEIVTPKAEALAAAGNWTVLERSYLMTTPGLEAALRLAESHIEGARFEAARMMLEQIDAHPDMQGAGEIAPRAAQLRASGKELWRQLGRYIPRPEVLRRAEKDAVPAGTQAGTTKPVTWPSSALERPATMLGPLPKINVEGLVSKPLWTAYFSDRAGEGEGIRGGFATGGGGVGGGDGAGGAVILPRFAQRLGVLPIVVQDLVVVSDGSSIHAWDRFSLSPRWMAQPGGDAPRRVAEEPRVRGRTFALPMLISEGAQTPTASGGLIVAATGHGAGAGAGSMIGREGNDRISGIVASTGGVLWTTTLGTIDPGLSEAEVRGPMVIAQGVVVIAARRVTQERRQVGLTLVGLDAQTGIAKWVRPIGSAGTLPWVLTPGDAESMLEADGVVYRTDRLGVGVAIEAASGRVRWIRRMPVAPRNVAMVQASSWQISGPILDGERVIVITPDGARVVALSRATGQEVASRDSNVFGEPMPRYLLRAGDLLAAVDDERVRTVPAAKFDKGEVTLVRRVPMPGIRGRVTAAGDQLLIPSIGGLAVVKPSEPDAAKLIALDDAGNALALDSQIIVADDARVHSYLLWDTAEKILTQRMKDEPSSAAPAVTFAELAYRSGRLDRVAEAIDAGLAAIARASGEDQQTSRRRLFELAHAMASTGLEPTDKLAGEAAGSTGPGQPGALPTITDRKLLEKLVRAMGELARSPDERLEHVLAKGRLVEQAAPAQAAEEYQRVLLAGDLTGATWRGPTVSVRGEVEATRRLEILVAKHGPGVYALPDAEAQRELAALGGSPTPEQLEKIIARYPLAQHSPALWQKTADTHRGLGQQQLAQRALENGLRSAQRVPGALPAVVAELAGQLIEDLRSRGQAAAAAAVLRSVRMRFPSTALTSRGSVLDAEKLSNELAARVASVQRWPRIGVAQLDKIQAMPGFQLLRPLLRSQTPSTAGALAMIGDDEVSLWAAREGDAVALAMVWSEKLDGRSCELVSISADAAILTFLSDEKSEIVRVGLGRSGGGAGGGGGGGEGGEAAVKWRVDAGDTMFPPEPSRGIRRVPGGQNDQWQTPGGEVVSPTDLMLAMDERTLVVMQRAGQVAGVDVDSGETLWTTKTSIGQVADADLSGGWLVLAGEEPVLGPKGQAVELRSAAQVLDARSGRIAQRIGNVHGRPHWVRVAESGVGIIAGDTGIAAFELSTGRANWTFTDPELMPARAGWVVGDGLVALTSRRQMVLLSISAGRVRAGALEMPKGLLEQAGSVDVLASATLNPNGQPSKGAGGFVVCTPGGIAMFSIDGVLLGADGLGGATVMLSPQAADGRLVTAETISDGRPAVALAAPGMGGGGVGAGGAGGFAGDGMMFFSLIGLDSSSGAMLERRTLLLGARPSEIVLMDGRVGLTAGASTIVIQAPASPQAPVFVPKTP